MKTSSHLKPIRAAGSKHPSSRNRLKNLAVYSSGRGLLSALGTIAGCSLVVAQVSFTRILEVEIAQDTGPSIGCAWGDYDNDGYPDLVVADAFGAFNRLYHNNGDGTMSPISHGPAVISGGNSHGCAWSDYDGDGDVDLFVVGGNGQNDQQFLNNGDGSFTRVTTGHLVNSGGEGAGISCADYDNDGDFDLLVTGWGLNGNRLYRNDGAVELTFVGGLEAVSAYSQNAAWGDYDNDGYLDLFIANYSQDNFLYHNNGDGAFVRVTEGALVHDGGRSSGSAWADYDNDGDLDLFVANGVDFGGGTPPPEPGFLYRNDGGTNHWLILRLVGVASNRSAIGAKLRVLATIHGKTFWQSREVSGGAGYLSQDDLRVHFGLGDAESVETVFIEWPSGVTQVLKNVSANQHRDVMEEPVPSIAFSFSEGSGDTTRNYGNEAGSGEITPTDGYPVFRPNVPNGPWAPPNNVAAMDFGLIGEAQGGRAIDFDPDLGIVDAFTICGWLNARDLRAGPGGNRIVCALTSHTGPGFELVQQSDGSLQLGVNQGAAGSPARGAAGRIAENPEASSENWMFFAVTYDGTQTAGNVRFYFGTGEGAAEPDPDAVDYDRGGVEEVGALTMGNVSMMVDGRQATGPEESRVFRGLLDELEIYRRALELEEVQAVQRAFARRTMFEPVLTVSVDGAEVVLEWEAAGSFEMQQCTDLGRGVWRNVRGAIEEEEFRHTFRMPISSTITGCYLRLRGN